MANTTNFGWETPDDTDLVKDGAAAMRTLGSAIDTSFVDLKGGTTGQNLRKATNTDLDFTWAGDATNTVIDAEGDLLVGDSADTLQRLAIGTTGQVLTVDTAVDGKIKWAAAGGGGKVLQVVQGTKLDTASVTGTTWTASGISVSITPSSTASKVLIIAQISAGCDPAATAPYFSLYRGASAIFQGDAAGNRPRITAMNMPYSGNFPLSVAMTYLDSPSTTSATTYEVYYRAYAAATTVYINRSSADANTTDYSPRGASSIIALEIGA